MTYNDLQNTPQKTKD